MRHYVSHKYSDGVEVTCEWSEFMDGPWKQKTNNLTVIHDYPFYVKDSGIDRN
jgi:hypothetical protein